MGASLCHPRVPALFWNRIVGLATVRVFHSRIRSPGVDASHTSGSMYQRDAKIFLSSAFGRGKIRKEPLARHPRRDALEEGRGAPAWIRRARRRELAWVLRTSGFTFSFSLEAETSGPACTDPSKLPVCQRAELLDQPARGAVDQLADLAVQ